MNIVYANKNLQIPEDVEIDIANRIKVKLGETFVMEVPNPHKEDNYKSYYLKFTINAYDE